MNGFELHGIKSSSPSQINTWIAAPDYWVLTKLYGKYYDAGFSAARGRAIESAVVNVLVNGYTVEKAIEQTLKEYDRFNILSVDPRKLKEREAIAPSVSIALEALAPYGEPVMGEGGQQKIELLCNAGDWSLPVVGYLDFMFPESGVVIDLKTTMRIPSEMSPSHARQAAIYGTAKSDMKVEFLYVSPKKYSFLNCHDDKAEIMRDVKVNLIRQEKFLSISPDKNVLSSIVPVNCESFYWDSEDAVRDRKELFGI